MNVLPDTSLLLDLLKGRAEAVRLWDSLRRDGAVPHLSPLVLYEIRFGFLWRGNRIQEAEFDALAAAMPGAAFTDDAAGHAADLQAQMMRKGIPLGQLDALIAGTAAAGRYVLVTGDAGLAGVRQAGIPVRTYGPPS